MINVRVLQNVDYFKSYRVLMSTIFKLLGSNSSIEEEVNRIVDLEKEFANVYLFDNIPDPRIRVIPFGEGGISG